MPRTKHVGMSPDAKMLIRRFLPMLKAAVANSGMRGHAIPRRRITGGMDWATGYFGEESLRDLTEACGYPARIATSEYYSAFERSGVATRVVETYPEYTWMQSPVINDDEEAEESAFEGAVRLLDNRLRIWAACKRADVAAGLGRYAVLLIGADDGGELETPLERASELLYLQPYREEKATIREYEKDTKNARYGKPALYDIQTGETGATKSPSVHWSRIIHIADNCLESNILGFPRLQRVWNDLLDIIKVSGGSAEMFWQGAFFGLSFEMDKDAEVDPDTKKTMDEEIEKYIHGLTRYLKLQGTSAKSIAPQVASPKDHIDMLFTMLSVASKIPKRILMGSEMGQLASGQDARNWAKSVRTRQENWAEPIVVRPLIDRLIGVGILPKAKEEDYSVDWPDIEALSEQERAEISKLQVEALTKYADSQASSVVPVRFFLIEILGWTPEMAEAVIAMAQEELDEETEKQAADVAAIAEDTGIPDEGLEDEGEGEEEVA